MSQMLLCGKDLYVPIEHPSQRVSKDAFIQ
uniref:Uncharacterized protein n=1 Tax=Anguilla anguilla TaxID=7936 RepID=A0A0E9UDT9_ANGAN